MKVSVIIPTYNREKYIGRVLRSLLEQAWPKENYEIIVVNDGSTDHTKSVLASFGRAIRILDLKTNKGLPYACNVGIKNALSRFVVRVDDDDYVHEDFLKTLYNFLAMNEHFDAVCCDYYVVDEKERVIERRNAKKHPIACGIMFRKDNLIDIGLYNEKFLCREDEELRIRYLKKYNIYRIELPLYRYMIHSENLTQDREKMEYYKNILMKYYNENQKDNKNQAKD